MTGKKQEITLQCDFDAVVRYGDITVEFNTDGSVVMNTSGKNSAYANGNFAPSPAPLPVIHNNVEKTKIVKLATEEAYKYGHATITFNHLLAALLKNDQSRDLEAILSPKVKVSALKLTLEKELGNDAQDFVPGTTSKFGEEVSRALRRAEIAVQQWRTDRLFGAELLLSMLGLNGHADRSITVDYIDLALSHNSAKGGGRGELRKAIGDYATATGEKIQCQPPLFNPGS